MSSNRPSRMCIGCNISRDKSELIRIVRTPEGEIILDTSGKINGRGAYICNNPECLEKAFKRKGLNRAFKINVSEEIYENLLRSIS